MPPSGTAPSSEPSFVLYPNSSTAYNPRIPCVTPVRDGDKAWRMEVETAFQYALAPFVTFPQRGKLEIRLRDNLRREMKKPVALSGGSYELTIVVARASEGRIPSLVFSRDGKDLQSLKFPRPLTGKWSTVVVQWEKNMASVSFDGEPLGTLEIHPDFAPVGLELQTYMVSSLHLEGDGVFDLDWSRGYAALVSPAASSNSSGGRLFGFDSFFVSQESAHRDYPMAQLFNSKAEATSVYIDFDLRSEVRSLRQKWTQNVTIPARTSIFVPIEFPQTLASDVYHLNVHSRGLSTELSTDRHFVYVERRKEPSGSPKFGLHDSNSTAYGYWPDALPISFAHLYAYWGYIQGPVWVKDFNGGWGIDPNTPPAEWNWNKRVEWVLGQGLTPYISIQSTPFLPWMRERDYAQEKMTQRSWGSIGGFPKLDLYRNFLKLLAERYRGKVHHYEVENEPNAHDRIPPADYSAIAQAVSEEIHSVDTNAQVYGICGTGDFVPWMTEVFKIGGSKFLNGVSVHTYVTPSMPEQANLPGKLAEVSALIDKSGKPMPLVNSETGTYVALREEVDRPIAPDRLTELIRQGTPNLAVPTGWPNQAVDERSGSISIVRNVVYNFLARTEFFIFFGWNPKWPKPGWWTEQDRASLDCFALVSATKDGVQTPSQYTLAMGVVTAQMEGVLLPGGREVNRNGILGGVFHKKNGGELAILWSSLGKRSAILKTVDSTPELVSLFGQSRSLEPGRSGNLSLHAIEFTEEPIYVHLKQPGVELMPSPVIGMKSAERNGDAYQVAFTLVNRSEKDWRGTIELSTEDGWQLQPTVLPFSLKPDDRIPMKLSCVPPPAAKQGLHTIGASVQLPDGSRFTFPIAIPVRPGLNASRLPDTMNLTDINSFEMPGNSARLDVVDQVAVGRPPQLASLQEEKYWKGPEELSAKVQVGANAKGIIVLARVRDVAAREPLPWPGVGGSCIELFFDFRSSEEGFGRPGYEKGVYQIILKPALSGTREVAIWNASNRSGILADTTATGGASGRDGYWIALQIPWKSIPEQVLKSHSFGFDVAIDGPPATGSGRKSQLVWAGGASNSTDASGFGIVTIPEVSPADGKK